MKPRETDEQLPYEELKRRFFEKLDNYDFLPKSKVPVVTLPVSETIAEAVRANPQSVRVSARGSNGVSVVGGPRRNSTHVTVRVDDVAEVDGVGRPIWPQARVVHEYNPFDALKWRE
jgi:hypothetical protein